MSIVRDNTWDINKGRWKTVFGANERITRMLASARLSVNAVRRDEEAKRIYVQHFQDAPLTYLDAVKNVISLMQNRVEMATQYMVMSYVKDNTEFNALGVGPLPPGVAIADVEAFVVQRGVAPATPLVVYIAPAFFTGDVYIPRAVNQRSGTGTILHELSHGVGNTEDHAYTWEPGYATLSAAERAGNADSYRAYCQSFDML